MDQRDVLRATQTIQISLHPIMRGGGVNIAQGKASLLRNVFVHSMKINYFWYSFLIGLQKNAFSKLMAQGHVAEALRISSSDTETCGTASANRATDVWAGSDW